MLLMHIALESSDYQLSTVYHGWDRQAYLCCTGYCFAEYLYLKTLVVASLLFPRCEAYLNITMCGMYRDGLPSASVETLFVS